MKKLYTVKVSFEFVVASEEGDERSDARQLAYEAYNDLSGSDFEITTKNYTTGDAGYTMESLPYTHDGTDKTVQEWLDDISV